MNQQETLNEIFNQCLERWMQGESIDHLLAEHSAFARDLEPLLRTAESARAFTRIQPRDEFKARARYQFLSAARELENTAQKVGWFRWKWQSAWSIGLAVAAVLVITCSSVVAGSISSMPGQALYPVKLATENVQLAMAFSDLTKTELNARFATRRAKEIEFLAAAGNFEQIQLANVRMNTSLSNISTLAQGENPTAGDSSSAMPRAAIFSTAQSSTAERDQSPVTAPATSQSANLASPAVVPAPVSPVITITSAPDATATPVKVIPVPQPVAMPSLSIGSAQVGSDSVKAKDLPLTESSAVLDQSSAVNTSNQAALSKYEKMRQIIEENYRTRQASLQVALEKASADIRPVIRQAMADSEAEYHKALQNLEQTQNLEQNTNRRSK